MKLKSELRLARTRMYIGCAVLRAPMATYMSKVHE